MSLTAVTWLIIEICSKVCRSFHRKHIQAYNLSKGHTAVVSPGGNECILPRVLGRHICQRRQKNMSSVGTCRYFTVGGHTSPSTVKSATSDPSRGELGSRLIRGSLAPNSISIGSAISADSQPSCPTHRQTDHATHDICSNRPRLYTVCRHCGLKIAI